MSRIKSVEEIQNLTESNHTPDKLARKYIVKAVDKLIRSKAREQEYSVQFQIPAIIVFQPRYDRDVVARAITKHYRAIGFTCDTDGYAVKLSWGAPSSEHDSVQDDESQRQDEASESSEEEETMDFNVDAKPSLTDRVASIKN